VNACAWQRFRKQWWFTKKEREKKKKSKLIIMNLWNQHRYNLTCIFMIRQTNP
jgi:hypothetical protein